MITNHKKDSPDSVFDWGAVTNPDVETWPVSAASDEEWFGCVNVCQASAFRKCVVVLVRSPGFPPWFFKHQAKNRLKQCAGQMVNIKSLSLSRFY